MGLRSGELPGQERTVTPESVRNCLTYLKTLFYCIYLSTNHWNLSFWQYGLAQSHAETPCFQKHLGQPHQVMHTRKQPSLEDSQVLLLIYSALTEVQPPYTMLGGAAPPSWHSWGASLWPTSNLDGTPLMVAFWQIVYHLTGTNYIWTLQTKPHVFTIP